MTSHEDSVGGSSSPAPDWNYDRYGVLSMPQRILGKMRNRLVPDRDIYLPVVAGLARGARLPVNPREEIRTWLGVMEIEIARSVRRLLPQHGICFDVGAHAGYYSLAFARLGAASVHAFEPHPPRFKVLQSVIAQNPRFAAQIHGHCLALTATGPASIDSFVAADARSRTPGLIKIDVDGAELDVLHGASATLAALKPRIVLETHSFGLEVASLQMLVDAGYVYRVIDAQRIWPELRPIEVNRWVIAVHRSDTDVVDTILRKGPRSWRAATT